MLEALSNKIDNKKQTRTHRRRKRSRIVEDLSDGDSESKNEVTPVKSAHSKKKKKKKKGAGQHRSNQETNTTQK